MTPTTPTTPKKWDCCEKCAGKVLETGFTICAGTCPCHSNSTQEKCAGRCEECYRFDCDCQAPQHTSPEKEEPCTCFCHGDSQANKAVCDHCFSQGKEPSEECICGNPTEHSGLCYAWKEADAALEGMSDTLNTMSPPSFTEKTLSEFRERFTDLPSGDLLLTNGEGKDTADDLEQWLSTKLSEGESRAEACYETGKELGIREGKSLERTRILSLIESKKKPDEEWLCYPTITYDKNGDACGTGESCRWKSNKEHNAALTSLAEDLKQESAL